MGLIAHYRLDGDATDAVGDNHGTASGVTWVDGKLGQAGAFNESQVGLNIPGTEGAVLSMSLWVKPQELKSSALITQRGTHSQDRGIVLDSSGKVSVFSRTDAGTWTQILHTVTLDLGRYTHVVFVQNKSNLFLFVDGVPSNETTMVSYRDDHTDYFNIGRYTNTPTYKANAYIDDVRIYDHALSQREVRDLSLGLHTHLPLTTDAVSVTSVTEAIVYGSPEFTGESVEFQQDGYLKVNDIGFSGPEITISLWSRIDSVGDGRNYLFDTSPRDSLFKYSDGSVSVVTAGVGGWSNFSVTDSVGTWTNYTLVLKDSTRYTYQNGKLINQSAASSPVAVDELWIGAYYGGGYNIDGGFRDFRIYATALTAAEVKEQYQQRASIDSEGSVHTPLLDVGVPYVSPSSSAETGWSNSYPYNDTVGESDPCSGLMTYQQALDHAYAQGGRLPTREEQKNKATKNTGCSYDFEYVWTCDKGRDETEHWVTAGDPTRSVGPDEIRSNDDTAYVRFVADDDLDRPDPVIINDALIREWLFT